MATMFKRGILGTKIGMTRIFKEDGEAVACTLVEAGPCTVVQRKTTADDGYDALQIGFGTKREKLLTKPMKGHFKGVGDANFRFLREVRLLETTDDTPNKGDVLLCGEVFAEGDPVDVIGTMKGRGYTGVIKRHHFATLRESHGGHFFVRHAGSIGSRKPQHTLPGTRMSGQHGNWRVTVQNLSILRIDAENNLLYVQGGIPGPNGGLVLVREAKKQRKRGDA